MLAKKYRLAKEQDIQSVFKKGKTFYGPFFNLKIFKNNLAHPRFCIIISTKISKKAAVRNKTKRQIRAILYKNLAKISQNYDTIILIKTSATISDFHQMEDSLISLLASAKLYK